MTRVAPARANNSPHAEARQLTAEERADSLLAAIRPNLVRLLLEQDAPAAAVEHAVRWPAKTDGKSIVTLHVFGRWGGL